MAAIPRRLRELLDHYRLRWRVVQAAMGLLMTLCAIVGGAGLGVLVDRVSLGAPKGVRWALLAAIAVTVAALLLRRVVAPVSKRIGDERAAARLGRNFPDMAEALVTGVELSRDADAYGVSKGLVDAALHQIDQRSETVSWRQAVPLGRLARVASVFAVLALAMAMAYGFAPEAVGNSIGRLLQPNREDFFSYTKLKVEPGDQVLRKGDVMQVRFSASDEHRAVTRATLQVRQAGGESFTSEISVAGGAGAWQSGPLLDDLRYRVRAGDNISPWYTVRTVPEPALSAKSVLVTPPAYTDRPETTVEHIVGPVTVVKGPDRDNVPQPSAVVIRVQPAFRGDDPKLACSASLTAGKETYPMKAEGGLLISPRLTPTEDVTCRIALKDGYGLTNRAPETISIKVVPDTKPVVIISKPASDLAQLPGARVSVTASATDDFGVRDLKLQERLVRDKTPAEAAPDEWKAVPLADSGGKRTLQRLEGGAELALADFHAVPGDHIDIRAVAPDYADEAIFRNGYSAIYRITIISNAEHLNLMLDQLRQVADRLDLASRKQAAQAKQTGELKDAPDKENKSPDAANAQQREDELRSEIKELESKLAEVMLNLSDNPMTPSSLLKELSDMDSAMDQAESKPMAQASNDLSKASQAKPSDSQPQKQNLQDAQTEQQKAEEELANLSTELKRIQRRKLLDILADEAERLSHDQADARAMTGKTALELGGRPASELPPADLDKVVRIAGFQKLIAAGIAALDKDIEKVLAELTEERESDAEKASDALAQMQDDRLAENSETVASEISENRLFAQTPQQQAISESLLDVANTLRASGDMSQAGKELQEFIKRQKELNARMEKLSSGDVKAADPAEPAPKPASNPRGAGAANPGAAPNAAVMRGVPVMVQAFDGPVVVRFNPNGGIGPQFAAPAAAPRAAEPDPQQVKLVGGHIGERQGLLEQDVSEHSLAMRDLFKELGLFKPETADLLDQASAQMGQAAQELPVPSLGEAIEHGKKALELLEEAAKNLPSDEQQMDQQHKGENEQMSMEEMMLLARIIGQMKALHADTGSADRDRMESPAAFPERVMELARRQSRIRYDTTKLTYNLQAKAPEAGKVVAVAGGKMDISHTALESGDAGQETRNTQSEAIQVLESLLENQENTAGAPSAAMMAMHNMSVSSGGGGFHGGSNGPLVPATIDANSYRISTRQKFDEKMAGAVEAEFPAEFRGLLNSYFDQVRKENRP